MKSYKRLALAGAIALMASTQASATVIDLYEYAFNIDGVVSNITQGDSLPAGVNTAGFDDTTGLGTIQVTVSTVGAHFVGLFVDHEIDEVDNTFFNEEGDNSGSPATDQSWEVDEPGYVSGDIYTNFVASDETGSALDNGSVPFGPEDVSMAMGWNFSLVQDQTALIKFLVATTQPTSGFYLRQTDPDSSNGATNGNGLAPTIYLSSTIDFRTGGTGGIPEPATAALLGIGLLGLWHGRRRQKA